MEIVDIVVHNKAYCKAYTYNTNILKNFDVIDDRQQIYLNWFTEEEYKSYRILEKKCWRIFAMYWRKCVGT